MKSFSFPSPPSLPFPFPPLSFPSFHEKNMKYVNTSSISFSLFLQSLTWCQKWLYVLICVQTKLSAAEKGKGNSWSCFFPFAGRSIVIKAFNWFLSGRVWSFSFENSPCPNYLTQILCTLLFYLKEMQVYA